MRTERRVAYFSMEIGMDPAVPTYAGGLGILAGDTVRAAADLRVPMVAVTLLHRKGYFSQTIDESGVQHEEPRDWPVEEFLAELEPRVTITIERRPVIVRAWAWNVGGVGGYRVPVYFLDTDVEENSAEDRCLSHVLYGGDQRYRLCQEAVLGIGGVRMLRALGHSNLTRFHMNEGHASLLTLELLDEEASRDQRATITCEDIETVHDKCVFTTHTPVPAGHDQFPMELAADVLGPRKHLVDMEDTFCTDLVSRVLRHRVNTAETLRDLARPGVRLNMTYLALNLSHYVNGVAKKHGEVSRDLFADYRIDSITNGIHAATWASPHMAQTFDLYIPGWREDNAGLRYALAIPREVIWDSHVAAKKDLLELVKRKSGVVMDANTFTVGFARRMTTYKRPLLVFRDIERLRSLVEVAGPVQLIFSGKAHPSDEPGKTFIRKIYEAKRQLGDAIRVAYLSNYDIRIAKLMIAGVDLWLNTPEPPLEASGTSGMKAAVNGVPSHSSLDGWWIEGCVEGTTGWGIGKAYDGPAYSNNRSDDAEDLYKRWEDEIIPQFYSDRNGFIDVMRHAIAINASFFNTQRMMRQYVLRAYF